MSTATLETYSLTADIEAPAGTSASDMIARNVKVFKVGSFKNSRGQQNTWTAAMLEAAVANFNHLRATRIFPDVPVRLDHSKSIRDVVGYFHELRFDGTFLLADISFTKKSAFEEYNSGHFRGRSLEIGPYETNDEKLYDIVVQGLAFVDIPAVEGLHQRSGEENMPTENQGTPAATTDEDNGVPAPAAGEQTPPAVPADPPSSATPPEAPVSLPSETPAITPERPNEHGRPEVQTFRINGVATTDAGAAQTHIDALEKFMKDTKQMLRNSFVDDLLTRRVITAAQKDDFSKHVNSLDDDQFAAFRALHGDMAPANLFGRHDTTQNPSIAAAIDDADALVVAKETIEQFRRMGKSEEFIKAQPSWTIANPTPATA